MKKKLITLAAIAALALAGCSAADTVSQGNRAASDNFEITRRIVFFNGITNDYLLEIQGLCSITVDTEESQLEVTCKVGEDEYKKHFLGLSDNATYFVEQTEPSDEDPFHYRVIFRPETVVPDIDVETSGS